LTAYLVALAVTIISETAVVVLLYPSARWRAGACCVLATTVTHIAMHHLLPRWVSSYAAWLVIGETGALAFEAAAYWVCLPRFGLPRAVVASALANLTSYTIGVVVLPLVV
jgi:hypothetical protein